MPMGWLWPALSRLGSRTLLMFAAVLFVIDLLVPDPLPFVDEIILGVTTLLLARRRDRLPGDQRD
jgi:uncharacterized protein DUF6116